MDANRWPTLRVIPLEPIQTADLNWDQEQPRSNQFNDIYFSTEDALAETEHVFIEGNQLIERWKAHPKNSCFVIGETGFGTGLNFLAARRHWLSQFGTGSRLHFVSCEKFPLRPTDLERALKPFRALPNFSEGIDQLLSLWPQPVAGFHRLQLDHGQIQLTLLFGEASKQLAELETQVDAWFLDGFAPAKNPDMWSDALFAQIGRLSDSGTSAATFTSAGVVKRGLVAAGFALEKVKGYGRKREMLRAQFSGSSDSSELSSAYHPPWLRSAPTQAVERVAIIGAGIAGATTARALAERGIPVDLFEREAEPATGGSSNPQGALYIKLPAKPTPQGRLHLAGLQFSQRMIDQFGFNDSECAELCGLLQVPKDETDRQRMLSLVDSGVLPSTLVHWLDQQDAEQIIGTRVTEGGIYFPNSGWAAPRVLTRQLLEHPLIQTKLNSPITQLGTTGAGWKINDREEYSQVVLCTAWETELIQDLLPIPVKPIRGQTSWASAHEGPQLRAVVCSEGYISPAHQDQYCFGASFIPGDRSRDERESEHQHNLALMKKALPELGQFLERQPLTGRVAQRAGSPDYMPIVGPVCSVDQLNERYAALSKNAKTQFSTPAPWIPGLFVNLGHGSKGLVSCPLSAEILVSQMLGEPPPIERSLIDLLAPSRFAIKALKQAKL